MMFGEGNFDAPMLIVHDSKNVPGTKAMTEREGTIRYQVRGDRQGWPSGYRDLQIQPRLRDELQSLLAEWDSRLANTTKGERAHLLETLGETVVIEGTRRQRRVRPVRSRSSPCR